MLHKCNILKKQKKDEHDNLNYSPYHILYAHSIPEIISHNLKMPNNNPTFHFTVLRTTSKNIPVI